MTNATTVDNKSDIDTRESGWQSSPFDILRQKWGTVPSGGSSRRNTETLMALDDRKLLATWGEIVEADTTGDNWSHRGWYHELYKPILHGQRVIDFGSGLGIDGITFARAGAKVTFVDIVKANLELIERICKLNDLTNVHCHWIESVDDLHLLDEGFDCLWAQGSLHHAPRQIIQQETAVLLEHLKPDARWIQLAYPKKRWEREGRLPFREWGEVTDGVGTPWAEWYDLDKVNENLQPSRFETILDLEIRGGEFNWFDLRRIDD